MLLKQSVPTPPHPRPHLLVSQGPSPPSHLATLLPYFFTEVPLSHVPGFQEQELWRQTLRSLGTGDSCRQLP